MKRTHAGAGLGAGNPYLAKKRTQEGANSMAITEESRGMVVQAIIDVLQQFHELGEGAIEGSRISKSLLAEPSVAELALGVKADLGGKGWMRKLVAGCTDIEYIDVQDREPCFRLAALSGDPIELKSSEKEAEEFNLPDELHEQAAKVIVRAVEILTEAAEAGEGFVAGSVIRNNLGAEFREISHAISEALGKQKGWLKKLLLTEPSIEQAQETGKGEPCFRLVGVEPARGAARVPKTITANKGKSLGKGKDKAPMFMEKGKGKMPRFMEKGKGQFMDAKGKGWMLGASMKGMYDPYSDPYCDPYSFAYGGMDPYFTPGASKGYGKMFDPYGPPPLQYGAFGGRAKGCHQEFTKGCKGKSKGASKTKGAKPQRSPAELAEGGLLVGQKTMVMELPDECAAEGARVSQVVRGALLTMQDENGGYVEGNKLSKFATQQDPDSTAAVKKAFLGKGWLKKLLSADPDVEQVTVEGKDEPCFRLMQV